MMEQSRLGERNLVLYDGVCGLCNRVVRFLVKRDRHDQLRFVALQSTLGREILARHNRRDSGLDTVLLVRNCGPSEELLSRSDAAVSAVQALGGIWRVAGVFYVLPRALRDAAYNFIARRRYRMFGKLDSCPVPELAVQRKFLDS